MPTDELKLLWWRDPIGDVPFIAILSVTGTTFEEIDAIINSHAALVEENSATSELVGKLKVALNVIMLLAGDTGDNGNPQYTLKRIEDIARPALTGDEKKGC